MKRWSALGAAAFAVVACQDVSGPNRALEIGASRAALVTAAKPIPGSYIVVMKDAVANVDGEVDQIGQQYGASATYRYKSAIKGFAGRLSPAAVAALRNDPRIAYIEEDQPMTAVTIQTGATWGLDRIDQANLPLNGTYVYNNTGAGVKAYIIDTGILFTHTEFGGRATSGYDAVDGGAADDCNGHGTHVAGTVGGATYGVAKNVSIVAVRVLDCSGSGTTSGVIAGVDWVTADHAAGAPAVANMSLGGDASTALDNAVANSISDGVTYGIAAGNSNANACNYSPARVATAITVGSTTSTDTRSSFSNFGTCVDIFAPGSSITSSWYTSTTATNTISGTSMATPHVVGAAALYLQTNTAATPAQVATALTTNATPNKVTSPGTGSPNRLLYTGFINAAPAAPVADFSFSCTQLACNFDGSLSSATAAATYTWAWGDATPNGSGKTASHTYGASGGYDVTLTVADGSLGTSTKTKRVTVSNTAPPPAAATANFTASCPTMTCTFNNTSTGVASGASHTWAWGDGTPNTTTSSTTAITHTYATAGNKSVTLTVTNPGAAASSITKTVTPRNCVNGNGDC